MQSPTVRPPRVVGVIPVRMESQRLPGKPLKLIHDRPMIAWVYERARSSPVLSRLTVATDADAILDFCEQARIPAVRTSSEHGSGTSRLLEVMDQDSGRGEVADIYVNIQGDEPMITPGHVELLLTPFLSLADAAQGAWRAGSRRDIEIALAAAPAVQVSTLKIAIGVRDAADPNIVKVVTDLGDRALYFSRAPIPFERAATGYQAYYKHLGFYAYTAQVLRRFRSLPASPLEQAEQLEQLRFLENGVPITVIETENDTIGVDTEDDLRLVEDYFRRAGTKSSEPKAQGRRP